VAADAAMRTAQAIFFISMISKPEHGDERKKNGLLATWDGLLICCLRGEGWCGGAGVLYRLRLVGS
jgi:hypothetical protein